MCKGVTLAVVSAMLFLTASADLISERIPREGDVVTGRWHSDLRKARAYAEANGLPLVAAWSNGRFCSHCITFENSADSAVFKEWMKDSGIVFYFGCVYDGAYDSNFGIGPSADKQEGYQGESYKWCRISDANKTKNWPYVRVYWPKGGVDVFNSGSVVCGEGRVRGHPCGVKDSYILANPNGYPFCQLGDYGTYNPAGRFMIDYLTNPSTGLLRNFKGGAVYSGGEFGVLDAAVYPDGGLQLEKGTALKSVTIPLTRTNTAAQASVATNCYMATFPDGTNTGIKQFVWAAGETYKELVLEFAASNLVQSARNDIEVLLGNDKVEVVGTTHITLVDPVPNSPKNPKWIGEGSIAPGVWTMDYAAATNAVKAYNTDAANVEKGSKAYTLLLFSGSLWCPDCTNNEKYITDSADFKAWATNAANPIACVAVDLPFETDSGAPCLLSWKEAQSNDGKQYFAGVTGAGYLSRHGVPLTGNNGVNAESILARNINSVAKDTVNGGFAKAGTTGIRKPTYVLLRDDGSVIGRIDHFGWDSSMLNADSASTVVKRLNELIAQDSHKYANDREERNDHPSSIANDQDAVLAARNKTGIQGTLSFADAVDYYRINANAGTELTLDLAVEADTRLVLEVVDFADGTVTNVVKAVTNTATSATALQCVLPSAKCYARISYPVNEKTFPIDSYFAFNSTNSTLCGYSLKSDSVYSPAQTMSTEEILDEILEVVIKLEHDVAYKFVGLDKTNEVTIAMLDYDESSDTYRLNADVDAGAIALPIVKPESGNPVFGFQQWMPGSVYFTSEKGRVTEKGDTEDDNYTFKFKVQRSADAVSGNAKVEVRFNAEESAYIDDPENGGVTFIFESFTNIFDTVTNVWEEGEYDARELSVTIKANTLADGVQTLVFDLVKLNGCDANADAAVGDVIGKFTLTVVDDDEALPGVIALTGAGGATIPENRVVYAKGGSELTVTVSRLQHSDGVLSGELLTNGVAAASFNWGGRKSAPQDLTITLPAYVSGGDNKLTIAAAGVNGALVDANYKYLTVKIIPEAAAEFATATVSAEAVRYVKATAIEVLVNESTLVDASGANVTVAKISGVLAPGLVADYDSTSKKLVISGTPTAEGEYTAVFQLSEDGVPGGTVQITIDVADPVADAAAGLEGNGSLAVARTLSDCIVVNTNSTKQSLSGLLTVTIVRSGRLSAKFRPVEGAAISLLSTEWSEFENGTFTAALKDISTEAGDYSLTVAIAADGSVDLAFFKAGEELPCIVHDEAWTTENSATAWEGYYTVSVPARQILSGTVLAAGDGYLTLKMQGDSSVNSGRMTYAGLLPNGKSVSGAATLTRGEEATVVLPVLNVSSSDVFTGVLEIKSGVVNNERSVSPYAGVYPYWKHTEDIDAVSYEVKMNAFGCKYSGEEDLVACCDEAFESSMLSFFAICDAMPTTCDLGSAAYTNTAPVNVTLDNLAVDYSDGSVAAENRINLYFNRATGIVYGVTPIVFDNGERVSALFKGVVLPGWGAANCSVCSEGKVERPFVSGSCWFSDVYRYQDTKGRNRTRSVKRSCPFSIGTVAGN